jgi:hypothetical protein
MHTFASWWVQRGGDLYRLSTVLGHSTLQMSARYGHLRPGDPHNELRGLARKWSEERQTEAPGPCPEPSAEAPVQPIKPFVPGAPFLPTSLLLGE